MVRWLAGNKAGRRQGVGAEEWLLGRSAAPNARDLDLIRRSAAVGAKTASCWSG